MANHKRIVIIKIGQGKTCLNRTGCYMETLKTIVCCTAHFTQTDNQLLNVLANDYHHTGSGNGIFSFYGGYIIRLYAVSYPVLDLKRMGISKALR